MKQISPSKWSMSDADRRGILKNIDRLFKAKKWLKLKDREISRLAHLKKFVAKSEFLTTEEFEFYKKLVDMSIDAKQKAKRKLSAIP